ncbi:alpha/beta hydrolase [Scopulibacillus cellulosilyticus]|uniref:Alpha/beta hydrolase n=1 Tax=Scopulibacillus cellulosilyticus TaxID=2665665 RepID=A0ABW2PTA6_9BACL
MIKLNNLEPGIRKLVEQFIEAGRPSSRNQSIQERREGYLSTIDLAGESEPVWKVFDQTIEGLRFRIYMPSDQINLPVLIYYHGGCFVSGDLETHDRQLRMLANIGQCLVVGVDYRLAPEHVYPSAHDDAFKAAHIVREHAMSWGGNPDNVTIVGDSAGGHLALVTCLRLKEQGQWMPKRQILIYPMLDATASSGSYKKFGDDYVITRDALLSGFENYLSNISPDHPEASPLYRNDLSGLPQTYILTAEYDPLVDEGEEFYRRLLEYGVDAQCQRYFGVNHGFFQLTGISLAAKKAIKDVASIVSII